MSQRKKTLDEVTMQDKNMFDADENRKSDFFDKLLLGNSHNDAILNKPYIETTNKNYESPVLRHAKSPAFAQGNPAYGSGSPNPINSSGSPMANH